MKRPNIDKYKGILFDLDGTLFDSITIFIAADEIFIRRHGKIPYPKLANLHAKFFLTHAKTKLNMYELWAAELMKTHGITGITAKEAMEERFAIAAEQLRSLNYKASAAKLLLALKQRGKALSLVTMTNAEALEIYKNENQNVKSVADFDYVFGGNIVTSDMVANKKPDPDCYIKALKQLGLHPSECLVFEDSLSGTLSATQAGIDTCVVYDRHNDLHRERLQEITPYYIQDFSEVLMDLNTQKLTRQSIRISRKNDLIK